MSGFAGTIVAKSIWLEYLRMLGEMTDLERKNPIDPRLIYLSFFAILLLAALMHLSTSETQSLIGLFIIAGIVIFNVTYLYRKSKRMVGSASSANRAP